MCNNSSCYFTDFPVPAGLLDYDIEGQASNSSAQSTKGNQAILAENNNDVHGLEIFGCCCIVVLRPR